jgi:hypothetical protein
MHAVEHADGDERGWAGSDFLEGMDVAHRKTELRDWRFAAGKLKADTGYHY